MDGIDTSSTENNSLTQLPSMIPAPNSWITALENDETNSQTIRCRGTGVNQWQPGAHRDIDGGEDVKPRRPDRTAVRMPGIAGVASAMSIAVRSVRLALLPRLRGIVIIKG